MAAEGREAARTAIDIWRARVTAAPDRPAYRYHRDQWVSMTWRQADEAAREIAGGLAALGVRRGDPVCVLAQTRVEWVLCDVGILLAGGATVNLLCPLGNAR